MLSIVIGAVESFDEEKQEFVSVGGAVIEFEHSLASLSKWESIFEKPFLSTEEKTEIEALAYIRAMVITPDVDLEVLNGLNEGNMRAINDYINSKQTATWFSDTKEPKSKEIITAEVIYCWMIAANVPMECQYWHLNRLMTLLKVIDAKMNKKQQKLGRNDLAAQRRALNARRRQQFNTRG